VKYEFVKEHQAEFTVKLLCDVLGISRSGYYDWLTHTPSKRDLSNQVIDAKIQEVYDANKKRYGAPRITKALKFAGISCSHTRVARRLKHLNLAAVAGKKYRVTTDSNHNNPIFDNVLKRDFIARGINEKWVGDITYIPTKEGWLYLAVVIDIYSRGVIGWAMSKRMNKQLVCDALTMALFKRKFPKGVIMHTDRGSQYCSNKYRSIIKNNKMIGSMSRVGNCWDNAIAESFFHSLKVELIKQERYISRQQARQSIFQYIEGYYNAKRIHSSIDYMPPNVFEYAC